MRYRRNEGGDVLEIAPSDTTHDSLRSDLAETRAALIAADKRMKALEFRLDKASTLLSEQLEISSKSQEEARKSRDAQQITQTLLLSFIAFTAAAGLLFSSFKDRQ